jgi:hypothetical protein
MEIQKTRKDYAKRMHTCHKKGIIMKECKASNPKERKEVL